MRAQGTGWLGRAPGLRKSLCAFAVLAGLTTPLQAEIALNLSGDKFWVVLASRQDPDEAIAAARLQYDAKAFVVRATNGWFASIRGPVEVRPGKGRAFLDLMIREHGAPKDAYLTRGASFTAVTWTQPATNVVGSLAYDGELEATTRLGDVSVTLSRRPDGDNTFDAVATGTYKGKPAFKMVMAENAAEKPAARVEFVRLDPESPVPQVVFTYFWQGAHCCTLTKIATLDRQGAWRVVDGETLDGDGGYGFEDFDGKSFSILTSSDQAFYYAFDSYASSASPLRLHQLTGNKLNDVTTEPRFQHRLLQDLYAIESSAVSEPDTWHSNGFLAGWVAASMRVGRGEAAWTKMLESYDRNSDFGPERCTIDRPVEKCPDDKRVRIPFPLALRQFLAENGYISDQNRYRVPSGR